MSSKSKLYLPGGYRKHARRVRNLMTGRVLPCCWSDCERAGDDNIRVEVPHNQPRWRIGNRQEMLVYIFCCERHKAMFVANTPYERYA